MDEKYIENLGGSTHVDEGLWDRLKTRAAGFTQAAKNISGKGEVGTTESAKFNSLFKGFIKNTVKTISDLGVVLARYENSNKLNQNQKEQLMKFLEAKRALIQAQNIPLTEASVFTRPFSLLGAQAEGGVDNIINAYKKRIETLYNNFVNDAKKLNIVPDEYIPRKIASIAPSVPDALQKLSDAIGKPLGGASPSGIAAPPSPTVASAPATTITPATAPAAAAAAEKTPTPAAPTPSAPAPSAAAPTPEVPPAPTPAPEPPKAAAPVTPPEPPTPSPVAPATPPEKPKGWPKGTEKWTAPTTPSAAPSAPTAATPPAQTPEQQKATKIFSLSKQSIDKLITSIPPEQVTEAEAPEEEEPESGKLIDLIRSYVKRDATKAEYPFPRDPEVKVENADGTITYWHMRYRFTKENTGHVIEVHAEMKKTDPSTGKQTTTAKSSKWETFISFNIFDIIDKNTGKPSGKFDTLQNILKNNPPIGKMIQEGEKVTGQKFIDEATNKKVENALWQITRVVAREPDRGKRNLTVGGVPPDQAGSGGPAGPPTGKPQIPAALTTKAPPEEKGRTLTTAVPVAPQDQPKAGKKAKAKQAAKKTEPTAEVPPAAVPTPSAPAKKKLTPDDLRKAANKDKAERLKRRESGLDEQKLPTYRDFFPL